MPKPKEPVNSPENLSTPVRFTTAFLEKTIKLWQPRYKEKLTMEDAREICRNSCALIELLDKLDKKYLVLK